jgi:hypothetical protein
MTDSPVYFQPIDVPAFCYIWEAVMWVGFGRFPEGVIGYETEDGLEFHLGAASFNWKERVCDPLYRFDGYWWFETEAAGLDANSIDWGQYEEILHGHGSIRGYIRPEFLAKEAERQRRYQDRALQSRLSGAERDDPDYSPGYLKNIEERLKQLPILDNVDRLLQHPVDRAWAKVFQVLVDGDMPAYGWHEISQDEIREFATRNQDNWNDAINPFDVPAPTADYIGPLRPMATLTAVPVNEWGLKGIAPDAHYSSASGRLWCDVMMPTAKLLHLFPLPLLAASGDQLQVERINPILAISRDVQNSAVLATKSATDIRAPRGRPKKADGAIERLCQHLYGKRLLSGEKETALAEDARQLVLATWGETLSRSAFQGYMQPYKPAKAKNGADRLPEIMPEIAAE